MNDDKPDHFKSGQRGNEPVLSALIADLGIAAEDIETTHTLAVGGDLPGMLAATVASAARQGPETTCYVERDGIECRIQIAILDADKETGHLELGVVADDRGKHRGHATAAARVAGREANPESGINQLVDALNELDVGVGADELEILEGDA